jgi:5-methylcytosine-specific restriction endonuclease McrA
LEWTDGRKKAFIVSVLRSGTRRWPPKYQTLNDAKTTKKINSKTKRLAQHYRCAICKKEYTSTNVEVDHINPVVNPSKGFTSWDDFIANLYCSGDNLQVLCKSCHKKKTLKEKKKKNED